MTPERKAELRALGRALSRIGEPCPEDEKCPNCERVALLAENDALEAQRDVLDRLVRRLWNINGRKYPHMASDDELVELERIVGK